MRRQGQTARDESRGVTSVMGIILLVGIAVILAAVVAGFTLDVGRDVGPAMPNTQLTVEDASDIVGDDNQVDDVLVLRHESGDEVATDDLLLVVSKDGTTYYRSVLKATPYSPTADAPDMFDDLTSDVGDRMEPGNTVTVSETVQEAFPTRGEYTVTVIHEPSDSILLKETVKID